MRCQKCGFTNSPSAKFCKQCGMGMPRAAAPAATTAQAAQSVAADEPVTLATPAAAAEQEPALRAIAAVETAQACPQCATSRVPGKRFCRQCRFDFAALDSATSAVVAASAQHSAHANVEALHETVSPINAREPQPELATIDADAAPEAFAAPVSAAPEASANEPTEQCPLCAAARAPGKRFCRGCRFDFAAPQPADETPAQPPHLEAVTAVEIPAEVTAEPTSPSVPASEAPIAAEASQPEAPQHASPEPEAEPEPEPAAAAAAMPAEARNGDGKKMWIIGGVAVVVVAVAVGAGLMLRSHHTPAASDDTEASAPVAASAPPFIEAASEAPAAQAASAPAPSLNAALNAPASASPQASQPASQPVAQADTSGTPDAAASGATIIDTRPQPQAQTQPQAEPQTPAPQAPAATQSAAPAPHVHEKPKKAAPPADANNGENATIRAAIAGNLSDGNSCFSNKKYDCAISNADAVLRLDPHNAQALSLRKRAKTAQQSALNSMSIE